MFALDVTKCIADLRRYYTCNKCGKEYVFSNLQGRSCEKCNKPDGKCTRINALAKVDQIVKLFITEAALTPTRFTICIKGLKSEWIVKEATACDKQNPLGEIPLHGFCKKRQTPELEQSIISNLYDINHKDFANWTPLHEAVDNDFLEGVEILLKHGVVCDVPGMDYTTALHKACSKQNEEMIILLLNYGARTDAVDCLGARPFDLITDINLKRKVKGYKAKNSAVAKTVYVPSTAKVYVCPEVDDDFKETLSKYFPSYKSSLIKTATHVIMKSDSLSLQVLRGILKGCIIYDKNKMEECNHKTTYTLNFSCVPTFKACFKKTLVNKLLGLPPLFDKMSFHVLKHKPLKIEGMCLTTNDLVEIIKAGGGEVLRREPTPTSVQNTFSAYHLIEHPDLRKCTNFIIFDEHDPPLLLYSMKELYHKSSKWLVQSVLKHKFI